MVIVRQLIEKSEKRQTGETGEDTKTEPSQEPCEDGSSQTDTTGSKQTSSGCKAVQRILKTLVFLICLSGFLYQTVSFFSQYNEMPTFTEVEMKLEDSLVFPAITVCQNSRLIRSFVCKDSREFCVQNKECEGLFFDEVTGDYTTQNNIQHVVKMSPQLEDFVRCKSEGRGLEGICNHVNRVFSADYPSCFTYNGRWRPEHLNTSEYLLTEGDAMVLDLNFQSLQTVEWERNVGGRFVLHNVHDLLRAGQEGFSLKPGHKYKVTFKPKTTVRLPPPHWSNCINYEDTWKEISNPDVPLVFTRKMCVRDCIERDSSRICGCLPRWLPVTERRSQNTSEASIRYCWPRSVDNVCLEQNLSKIISDCQSNCPHECYSVNYDVEMEEISYPPFKIFEYNYTIWDYWKRNNVSIRIEFKSSDHVIYKYKLKYQDVELLSFIGGYVGVWLGISFVAFFDFLLNFALLLRCLLKKNATGRRILQAMENCFAHGLIK